jgi:catechol 2,3-dioxygenase-like lactoylglutathione lyase family enzyme
MDAQVRTGSYMMLGQIARTTKRFDESHAWYRDALGLPELYSFGNLAFYDLGGVRLMLTEEEGDLASESILYLRVPDIHASKAELAARGVKFINAPHLIHRHEDGTEEWMAAFEDNEGRPLQLKMQVRANVRRRLFLSGLADQLVDLLGELGVLAQHAVDLLGQLDVLLDQLVHVVVDLEQRLGVLVGLLELHVRLGRRDLLADHDDRQEDELEEGLGEPGDQRRGARLDRGGKADQRERREGIGAPHGADHVGDPDRELVVETVGLLLCFQEHVLARLEVRVRDVQMRHVRFVKIHGVPPQVRYLNTAPCMFTQKRAWCNFLLCCYPPLDFEGRGTARSAVEGSS